MKIVMHEQGSQPWLDWRLGGVGSSDAMVIAAAHGMVEKKPWMRSMDALFDEKMSGVSKVVENARMRRGTEGEPFARAAFEKKSKIIVQPLCAEMDARTEVRASFDGITFDGNETIEIKCPHESVHAEAKAGRIIGYYVPQVVHQGLVAWGEPDAWPDKAIINFYSFVPETGDGAWVRKSAREFLDFARALYQHELDFLECLKTGVRPCGVEYTTLAKQYLVIEKQVKELQGASKKIKEAMIGLLKAKGTEAMDGAGVNLACRTRAGTIDYVKLCAEYGITEVEQERYRKRETKFWQAKTDLSRADPDVVASTATPASADVDAVIAAATDDFWTRTFESAPAEPRATKATQA